MNKQVLELLTGAIENAAEAANGKMVRHSEVGDSLTDCSYAQDIASFYKFLSDIRHIDDIDKLKGVDDWDFIKWWALDADGINCIHEYAEDYDLEEYEEEVIKLFE